MFYKVNKKLVEINDIEEETNSHNQGVLIGVYPFEQESPCKLVDDKYMQLINRLKHMRYCKAEVYEKAMIGALAIPKKIKENHYHYLAYYITKQEIILFDNSGFAKELLKKMQETKSYDHGSVGHIFYSFLELLTEEDLLYMEDLENHVTELEEQAMVDDIKLINPNIMHLRKKSFVLYRYYSQMVHMSEKFLENEIHLYTEAERKLFGIFKERCEQLLSEATMLQEYARQVREVYQSQIDIKQNTIMRVLTVVTTIFMPLTLITGWYGMNFTNMPELSWALGYPVIIVASILILLICIWIFKKKKFF